MKVKKQVAMQLTVVRNTDPVSVSSNICNQIHVQIMYSLEHLQDLIPNLVV